MRPGCWQPQARLDDMDDQPRRGVALLPELPALRRADLPAGQGQGAREALRRGLQRLDGRRVVRAAAAAASSRCASSRCGTSSSRPPRCAATRPAACGPSPSASCPPGSGCRASTPATGTRSSAACDETGTVVCMHIGSGTKTPADVATTRPTRSARVDHLRQQRGVADRLPVLRRARALPEPQAPLRRGADRLDPLRARARRRRVGDAPRVERQQGATAREPPSHLLLPPGLQLLLQGPGRRRAARPRRRRQHHVRDRLPAPGRHLAALPPGRGQQFGHLDEAVIHKIARGNAIQLLGLDLPLRDAGRGERRATRPRGSR